MPRLLKPIKITDHKFLIKIFGQCLEEEDEWKILDQELGSPERGTIDLLGVNPEKRAHLVTICQENIEEGLIRSFKGYRWFKENQPIIKRIFSPQDISHELPARLVLFIEHAHPEASKMAQEICRIPITLYRYICFGPKDDPFIYVEPLEPQRATPPRDKVPVTPIPQAPPQTLDIGEIKKRLKIELADLSEKEIQEFLNLDLP